MERQILLLTPHGVTGPLAKVEVFAVCMTS